MTRYAQIVGATVHGVYEYDPLPEFAPNIVMIPLPADSPVQPGWRYEGGEFVAPEPEPDPVPYSVSMRKVKLALYMTGNLLSDVEELLDSMPGDDGAIARIEWATAQEVKRDWPLVVGLGAQLGLTEGQIDDLFRFAATLPE